MRTRSGEPGRRHRFGVTAALVCALVVVLEVGYLLLDPHAPDLAAQLARASAVSRGVGLWWAGWYGGISTPTYSLVTGSLMNALGVPAVGMLATIAICLFGADLVRGCARPRLGAVAISIAACANLYSGRITFAAGMAVALAGFSLQRRGRTRLAVLGALVTGVVSPLAAMYQVIGLAALAVEDRERRRAYLVTAAAACLPVLALSVLFAQPSYMPFGVGDCVLAVLVCVGVFLAPVPRLVRTLAVLSAVVAIGAWVVPSPVGSNAARLPMLLGAPLVLATARGGRRWASPRLLVLALAAWPVTSFSADMAIAAQPSAQESFYLPLLQHLPAAGHAVQRLEVLDPESHAGAYYLSQRMPLARGWERQIDLANNPVFYDGSLTPALYREWLVTHAVGWVAVPRGTLDYGSTSESQLLVTPPPFLHLVWANADWRLFKVATPAPAATGVLRVTALTDTGIDLRATRAGQGLVRIPYNRLLTVHLAGDPLTAGCIAPADPGSILVTVPGPGRYVVRADLTVLPRPCPVATGTATTGSGSPPGA